MSKVTLRNIGKRTITVAAENGDTVDFKPSTSLLFPEAIAFKLRAMYPKEVMDQGDVLDAFKGPVPEAASEGLNPPPPAPPTDEAAAAAKDGKGKK